MQLHFGIKQLKIDKTMGVLHSFVWNYVKYTNMEGFHRDTTYTNMIYIQYVTVHTWGTPKPPDISVTKEKYK